MKKINKCIETAKTRNIPKMLFSEFWFEGEICILFADANVGKSILAVQIADSISKGEAIEGFKLEVKKQPVIYFDFELTDKQLEKRYSLDYKEHYLWSDNLLRAEINPDFELPEKQTFEDFLILAIEQTIISSKAKILIIDNITYLKNETEKSKDATILMKQLKALKNKYNLSLLVLAHTPKRDNTKEITRNDLGGSKMLMNFCDTSFTIGESQKGHNIRYIKQIKERNTEKIYNSENVCICRIDKPFNFLKFVYQEQGQEKEHLKTYTEFNKTDRINEALELRKQGLTFQAIADRFGVTDTAVRKWVNGN